MRCEGSVGLSWREEMGRLIWLDTLYLCTKLSKVNVLKVSVAKYKSAVLTFKVFLLHGSMRDAIP